MPSPVSHQQEFKQLYVTSTEIMRRLNVTRTAIAKAKVKGILPNAIDVEGQFTVWKRPDIEPFIEAWDLSRKQRAGVA